MSGNGTKRNYLGKNGTSGAEGTPAAPSTWRRQQPMTHWRGQRAFADGPCRPQRQPLKGDEIQALEGDRCGGRSDLHDDVGVRREVQDRWRQANSVSGGRVEPGSEPHRKEVQPLAPKSRLRLRADNLFGPCGWGVPLWPRNASNASWPPFSPPMWQVPRPLWAPIRKGPF